MTKMVGKVMCSKLHQGTMVKMIGKFWTDGFWFEQVERDRVFHVQWQRIPEVAQGNYKLPFHSFFFTRDVILHNIQTTVGELFVISSCLNRGINRCVIGFVFFCASFTFFVVFVWSQAAWVKGGFWRLIKSQTPFSVQCDALLTSNMAASAELPAFKGVDCLISRRVSARWWRIVKHESEPRVPAWHPACYLKTPPSMLVFGRPANACLIREAEITVHQRGFLPARCHGSLFRRVRVNSKKGGRECENFPHRDF